MSKWYFWNAFTPITGPFLISFFFIIVYLWLSGDRKIKDLFQGNRLSKLTNPAGTLYFSLTTAALAYFTYTRSEARGLSEPTPEWAYIGSITIMLLCLGLFAVYSIVLYQEHIEEDEPFVPRAKHIIPAYLIAFASAIIGYQAYFWNINLPIK